MKLSLETTAGTNLRIAALGALRRGRNQSDDPLRTLVGSYTARTVWLNLRGVTSFDASGIEWLCKLRTAIQRSSGQLRLLHVPASLRRALYLLQLRHLAQCAGQADRAACQQPENQN